MIVLSKGIRVFTIIADFLVSQYINTKMFWRMSQFAKKLNVEVKWIYPEAKKVKTNIFLIPDFFP